MSARQPLVYKVATEAREFELIHRLNYRTFVEEIPQHPAHDDRRLVDRLHAENTYVIGLDGAELVGMIALRGKRPFSLDLKLDDLDCYLPHGCVPCEARLLAVEPRYRKTSVFLGMLNLCVGISIREGYDLILISGTTRQLKLYAHMGFKPFGPLVGGDTAKFQPMSLSWRAFESSVGGIIDLDRPPKVNGNFLPGPVAIAEAVREACAALPISHRSEAFDRAMRSVRTKLCAMTRSRSVAVFLGSGTLANDVIAAQVSRVAELGLILVNGEFGDRLVDHARRFGLDYQVHGVGWGEGFDLAAVEQHLRSFPGCGWIWAVHCETSTGVLNDLTGLSGLATEYGVRLCMDCVSSIGAVDVDMSGVWLASGVSGKALGAYPGLGMVVVGDRPPAGARTLPRSLDLDRYLDEVPFTSSSNLVAALEVALGLATKARQERLVSGSRHARRRLAEAGLTVVADQALAAPHVLTIALPLEVNSTTVARRLAIRGFLVAHASQYLQRRNWIQICLMGEFTLSALDEAVCQLAREASTRASVYPPPIPTRVRSPTIGGRGRQLS